MKCIKSQEIKYGERRDQKNKYKYKFVQNGTGKKGPGHAQGQGKRKVTRQEAKHTWQVTGLASDICQVQMWL